MTRGTPLLNDDGTASMATLLLMSHHAFRRDLSRFAAALNQLGAPDPAQAEALRGEWRFYREALHGHHLMEDSNIFPGLKGQHPELAAVIAKLSEEHHRIDPLLVHGDRVFGESFDAAGAKGVVSDLQALLREHLEREEASVVPHLRGAKAFPPPPDESMLEVFAQGFAWSMQGIDEAVTREVAKLLPPGLVSRLPAAQAAFNQRCLRVWGSAEAGRSRTSVPEG
jgi:hypothetical protein